MNHRKCYYAKLCPFDNIATNSYKSRFLMRNINSSKFWDCYSYHFFSQMNPNPLWTHNRADRCILWVGGPNFPKKDLIFLWIWRNLHILSGRGRTPEFSTPPTQFFQATPRHFIWLSWHNLGLEYYHSF